MDGKFENKGPDGVTPSNRTLMVYGSRYLHNPLHSLLANDPGAGKPKMAGPLIKELADAWGLFSGYPHGFDSAVFY